MDTKTIISVRNMNVTYFPGKSNEVRALKNINLEIHDGEFIVFFGPSGCGKSTLLYSVAGLERQVQGDIIVEGKNLRTLTSHEIEQYHQRTIGMIFQSFYLISSLSILQNVVLPQIGVRGSKKEREDKAIELLKHFGVAEQMHKLPSELSGGQQQRVAICRSLVNDPTILVADEPVGNLDSKSSLDVMSLLRELNDVHKKTVILVTHDPSHLRHAHRIFYLRDGEIVDTKENTQEERMRAPDEPKKETPEDVSGEYGHWAKVYKPKIDDSDRGISVAVKAQEIIADIFTHLTREELGRVETEVCRLIMHNETDATPFREFLQRSAYQGGMEFPPARARAIADQVQDRLEEILLLDRISQRITVHQMDEGMDIVTIRDYLLQSFKIEPAPIVHASVIDAVIEARLMGKLSRTGVQKRLSLSFKDGGAGLGEAMSAKIARRLESIIPFERLHRKTAATVGKGSVMAAAVAASQSTPPPPTSDTLPAAHP